MEHQGEHSYLYLGGGPDEETSLAQFNQERKKNPFTPALIAQDTPSGKVVVMDMLSLKNVSKAFRESHPNLHMVQARAEEDKQIALPFADGSFNQVNMDFVYRPFATSKLNSLEEIEAFEDPVKPRRKLEEIPVYRNALAEAARVLRPEGSIVIQERTRTIKEIKCLLASSEGQAFLQSLGLTTTLDVQEHTLVADEEQDFRLLSPQGRTTLKLRDIMLGSKRPDLTKRAKDFRVFTIKLQKQTL